MTGNIYIDWDTEIIFDTKPYEEGTPEVPVMNIPLGATLRLDGITDGIRIAKGFLPINPVQTPYDEEGWYNYHIDVFLAEDGAVLADHINAIVQSENAPDDFVEYSIPLSDSDRHDIMERLNAQCIRRLGQNCEDLLKTEWLDEKE